MSSVTLLLHIQLGNIETVQWSCKGSFTAKSDLGKDVKSQMGQRLLEKDVQPLPEALEDGHCRAEQTQQNRGARGRAGFQERTVPLYV